MSGTHGIALGLMSGTSADGVSAAVGQFQQHQFKFLGSLTIPYPEEIAKKIWERSRLTASEISLLNVELGEIFAHAANKLIKKCHLNPAMIECIGSHGQTIYHGPNDRQKNTLQIADPALIAERTGVTVVSHFRQKDIAAGGEGAPLIPFFDQFFFGTGGVKALLNIGGIANVTIVGKSIAQPLAFDTGPGNCLMDLAVRLITNDQETMDHNGTRAKNGHIDMDMVSSMIAHPYFKQPPPKSTGPELFNEEFLQTHSKNKIHTQSDDVVATLNYFTCLSIQESFRQHIFNRYPVEEIIVSGGGVLNKVLMKKLSCLFAPIPVKSIETTGLPALAKEPLAFGFFGLRSIHGLPNHLPHVTGAKYACVLGSITKPSGAHK